MLGDAEAVIDRSGAAGRIEPGRLTYFFGIDAGRFRDRLGRVTRLGDKERPFLKAFGLTARGDERLIDQPFGDDDVRERIEDCDVRARS